MKLRDAVLGMAVAGVLLIAAACSDDSNPTGPDTGTPAGDAALLSVSPAGGAANVGLDEPVQIGFTHPMDDEAAEYVAVHQGDVTGPVVGGTWMWSDDFEVLTFQPDRPWEPGTLYTIHMGGGMMGATGQRIDFEAHGPAMGGQWATEQMTSGGMMGGGPMGPGWRHANGTYGMVFMFRTAG